MILIKAVVRVAAPLSALLAGTVMLLVGVATVNGRNGTDNRWWGWIFAVASVIPFSTGLLMVWALWRRWKQIERILSKDILIDILFTYVLALLAVLGAGSLWAGQLFRWPWQLTVGLAYLFLIPLGVGIVWQVVRRRRIGRGKPGEP
jgi:hypothetical protein